MRISNKWLFTIVYAVAACLAGVILVEVAVLVALLLAARAADPVPTLVPAVVQVASVTPRPQPSPTLPPATPTDLPPTVTAAPSPTPEPSPLPTDVPAPSPVAVDPAATLSIPAVLTTPAAPQLGQHAYFSGTLGYLLYLPPGFAADPEKRWPVTLFLHGIDERGTNPEWVANQGLPKLVNLGRDFDFILISPQCPLGGYWADVYPDLMNLVDQVVAAYRGDPRRVYLTGISMGGYGALGLALANPGRFAALAPIASGYTWDPNIKAAGHYSLPLDTPVPPEICALRTLPIWYFHGNADIIIPPSQSQMVVDALRACGADPTPKRTELPGADHVQSWERAYDRTDFYDWLLSQRRPGGQP